jgi:hypothetical protein
MEKKKFDSVPTIFEIRSTLLRNENQRKRLRKSGFVKRFHLAIEDRITSRLDLKLYQCLEFVSRFGYLRCLKVFWRNMKL